ncbi:MAG: aminomethyl-transferring glycine dehydrogenase, partial [Saprospiraceae bacterium]
LNELINQTVPKGIRLKKELAIPAASSEFEYLESLKKLALQNKVFRNFIGMGYNGTITPSVIARNVFQNPGWYTQYTPYQAEIAQGRLESLLNFQTMVSDLTGLPIANASLLDEGTAAAEAMTMFYAEKNKRAKSDFQNVLFVADTVLPQTIDIIKTRAAAIDIKVVVGDWTKFKPTDKTFAIVLQYPNMHGNVEDYRKLVQALKEKEIYTIVAADLLSLALLTPPGEWGADAVVGNTQRFGVPMGYGGPHAAFFATKDDYKRQIPGRIIGMSVDNFGKPALRMALQTREQHIRREKATSNICTAQALLANMAAMFAVYHGPKGIKGIATKIHHQTQVVNEYATMFGFRQMNSHFFDTLCIEADAALQKRIKTFAERQKINFYYGKNCVQISLDETVTETDITNIAMVFAAVQNKTLNGKMPKASGVQAPKALIRQSAYLLHPVFNSYHTESNMMRYIKRLENKDLSLTHSMISLGSCTMKLNAATEMIPVSWENFANMHPFAPINQVKGYQQLFKELEEYLCACTGFDACSLQPNSGAQGEFAGLLTIKAYHEYQGDHHRNIALIPSSAHGTNPASAVMAGMEVVVVNCDEKGNIDVADLREKAKLHQQNLSCLMVTYPSTHGVFETAIKEICNIIHQFGGKVYMDGANMNAQVGLTSPAEIGADVCHLNLHKTFAIPHGGGGPGVGPICVNKSLAPYLPTHAIVKTGGKKGIHAISAAPWGSASILLISYGYIKMLGKLGLKKSTEYAILNSNYIKARLEKDYAILYTGEQGRCAHELILDLRPFKSVVSAEDVAKRLIDYGFHAPTLSFPVAGTIMIEPTESESKAELDRFCDALLAIKTEIDEIAKGEFPLDNNVLFNAPHTQDIVTSDTWAYPYTREKAAFPLPYLREGYKFWASVSRINNAQGDRNLICTCPPIEAYAKG